MAEASLGQAVLRVGANTKGFAQGMGKVSKGLTAATDSVQKFAGAMSAAGKVALAFSASVAAAFTPIILIGSKFEKQMSAVKSVMTDLQGPTSLARTQFRQLSDTIRQLGATTQFTAKQVGEAAEFLGLAGFSAAAVMEGLSATLNLAAAGTLELGRASDIASDTMSAFRLEAQDLTRVTDVFAVTAANANTTVELMGSAMQFAAPMAAALGQSIETTATLIGILANSGIKGSSAGTGLAQSWTQLVKKGEEVNKVLRKYGLTFEQINPEVHDMIDVIKLFEQANISAGDVMELFGSRAGRSILAMVAQGGAALDRLQQKQLAAAGAAQMMADIRMDNVIGDWLRLKSALEGITVTVFKTFSKGLRGIIASLTRAVDAAHEWVKANEPLVQTLVSIAAAAAAVALVFGTLAIVVGVVVGAVAGLVAVGVEALAMGALIVAGVGVQAAIMGTVLTPILAALARQWEKLKSTVMSFWAIAKGIFDAFAKTMTNMWKKHLGPAFKNLENSVGALLDAFKDIGDSLKELMPLFEGIVQTIAGGLTVGIVVLTEALNVFTEAATFATDVVGLLGTKLAGAVQHVGQMVWFFESSKVRKDRLEAEAAATLKATTAVKKQATALGKLNQISRTQATEDRKALAIMEKLGTATPLMLKQLQELRDSGAADIEVMKARIKEIKAGIAVQQEELDNNQNATADSLRLGEARIKQSKRRLEIEERQLRQAEPFARLFKTGAAGLKKETAKLEESIEAKQKELDANLELQRFRSDQGLATDELQEKEVELNKVMAEQERQLDRLNAQSPELLDLIKQFGGDTAKAADEMERQTKVIREGDDAIDELAATEEAFAKLRERLTEKQRAGMAAEFEASRKLREESLKLLESRKELLEKEKAGLEVRIPLIKEYTDEAFRAKQLAVAEGRLAEINAELSKSNELVTLTLQEQAEAMEKTRDTAAALRSQTIQDLQIEQLQREGDIIGAARAVNVKILEEEKKKNDKIFQMDGKNNQDIAKQREATERLQAEAARERLRAAFDKADKVQAIPDAARAEASIEENITGSLGKQVKTLQQMFMLYRAIAFIRRAQEQEAAMAVDRAILAEAALDKLKKRRDRAGGGEAERLDLLIKRREAQLQQMQQVAGKRAGEAQLGDIAGRAGAIASEQTKQKMQAVQQEVMDIRNKILGIRDEITGIFAEAPTLWVDAFVAAWMFEGQRIIMAIRETMSQLSLEMDPSTRHSPSLLDVWDANVGAVKDGVQRLQGAIQSRTLDMGQLTTGQTVQPVPMAGGFQQAPMAKNFNDNRRVDMTIHSNVDLENVERHIGRALSATKMSQVNEV